MEGLKLQGLSVFICAGVPWGNGATYLSKKMISSGVSRVSEQQLQIQNGEHESSPQLLECCSWLETWLWFNSRKYLAISTIPPPPSPHGINARAKMYNVNIYLANFMKCKCKNKSYAMQLQINSLLLVSNFYKKK